MIVSRKQAYFLPCFREHAVSCILSPPGEERKGNAAAEEVDFPGTIVNDPFMVKLFCMAFLAGCLCCVSARSGVRMVDVVRKDASAAALDLVASRVKDAASCNKVAEQLNRKADCLERLWREAFLSGMPTLKERARIAEWEAQQRKRTRIRKAGWPWELAKAGRISEEDAGKVSGALGRVLLASGTALKELDGFIAEAELPLPSSPDGDSYEKLLAWKWSPEHSLVYWMEHDPVANGALGKVLACCWNGGIMALLEDVLYRLGRERCAQLIRRHADRKEEAVERLSRLPALTPVQWCWFQQQERRNGGLADLDAALVMSLCGTSLDDWVREDPFSGREEMEREPAMESAWLYWHSAPDRAARVWKELAEKD